LRKDRSLAFIKLKPEAEAHVLLNEEKALLSMMQTNPRTFRIADPLFSGTCAGWAYLAFAPLARRMHRPARDPALEEIIPEISAGLREMPRTPDTPSHWSPMHGDFTPWNLRRVDKSLYLLDWEAAASGPPGADEVMYRTAAAAMGLASDERLHSVTLQYAEAVGFWRRHWNRKIEQHLARGGVVREKALAVQMVRLLDEENKRS